MTVRLAILGCGSWGINHVRSARSLKNAQVAAVCDAGDTALARAKDVVPLAKALKKPEEVFQDPNIDAVIIATPAPTHGTLAQAALAAGKHVLVEKPFVLDPKE